MEKTYSISEIGKLVGLGNDAIRFYEKKGLVHPSINPNNQYRMYTLANVLELLDIIYYRHLDFSIADICELSHSLQPQQVYEMTERQKQAVQRRIRYEQQLLKKITYIQSLFQRIKQQAGICTIQCFPASLILFESENKDDFFHHEIRHVSADEFVLCSMYRQYAVKKGKLLKQKTYVTLDRQIVEDLQMDMEHPDNSFLPQRKCVHLTSQMYHGLLSMEDIERIHSFAEKEDLLLEPTLLVREIPLTFYHDIEHYYAEIYALIKEKS